MHPILNTIGFFTLLITVLLCFIFIYKLMIFLFNRKHFPTILLEAIVIGSVLFLGIFVYIQYFFTFEAINKKHMQEGPQLVISPTGKYTANAFYEPYGGASSASGVNVWIEIINNEEQTFKTIYYADAKRNVSMRWLDEETISIGKNGKTKNSDRSIK